MVGYSVGDKVGMSDSVSLLDRLIFSTPPSSSAVHMQLEDFSTHEVFLALESDRRELVISSHLGGSSLTTDDLICRLGFVFSKISCWAPSLKPYMIE